MIYKDLPEILENLQTESFILRRGSLGKVVMSLWIKDVESYQRTDSFDSSERIVSRLLILTWYFSIPPTFSTFPNSITSRPPSTLFNTTPVWRYCESIGGLKEIPLLISNSPFRLITIFSPDSPFCSSHSIIISPLLPIHTN